jgi:hypothetical protein
MEGEAAVAQQNFEEAREDASKRLADLMQEYLAISNKVRNSLGNVRKLLELTCC